MKYKLSNCLLEIDAQPGVYSLGQNSGTGKTYLFNLLKQLRSAYQELKILVASYGDFTEEELINRLTSNKYDIIMMDRYEIWSSELLDYFLYKQKGDAVIMLDVKDLNNVILEINGKLDIKIIPGEVKVSEYVDTTFRRQACCR